MKTFTTILSALWLMVTPVLATDVSALTDPERQAFREEVRAYLLDNPEVLMEAIGILEQRQAASASSNDATMIQVNAKDLFEDPNSFVDGNPDGDVVMVEFLDYRCGYCKKAHPEVAELLRTDKNIRLIVKEFPILGDQSILASRFAISVLQNAGPEAYKNASNSLMAMRADITNESLKDLAVHLELDARAIMAGMNLPSVDQVIGDNHALAGRMNISGTPSFIMGDQMMRGYVPLPAMQDIVASIRNN